MSPAMEAWSLKHWTAREVSVFVIIVTIINTGSSPGQPQSWWETGAIIWLLGASLGKYTGKSILTKSPTRLSDFTLRGALRWVEKT